MTAIAEPLAYGESHEIQADDRPRKALRRGRLIWRMEAYGAASSRVPRLRSVNHKTRPHLAHLSSRRALNVNGPAAFPALAKRDCPKTPRRKKPPALWQTAFLTRIVEKPRSCCRNKISVQRADGISFVRAHPKNRFT